MLPAAPSFSVDTKIVLFSREAYIITGSNHRSEASGKQKKKKRMARMKSFLLEYESCRTNGEGEGHGCATLIIIRNDPDKRRRDVRRSVRD